MKIYSLSKRVSLHFNFASAFRGPAKPTVEVVGEMESNINNRGGDRECEFYVGRSKHRIAGKC